MTAEHAASFPSCWRRAIANGPRESIVLRSRSCTVLLLAMPCRCVCAPENVVCLRVHFEHVSAYVLMESVYYSQNLTPRLRACMRTCTMFPCACITIDCARETHAPPCTIENTSQVCGPNKQTHTHKKNGGPRHCDNWVVGSSRARTAIAELHAAHVQSHACTRFRTDRHRRCCRPPSHSQCCRCLRFCALACANANFVLHTMSVNTLNGSASAKEKASCVIEKRTVRRVFLTFDHLSPH